MAERTESKSSRVTSAPLRPPTKGAKKAGGPNPTFRAIHGVVKTISIVVGLPLTVVSLMSLVGLATGNFWIRLVPALVVALGAPLFLVDKLLPDEATASSRGLATDVLALVWLCFGVLYVGVAHPVTGRWLINEADHYARAGTTPVARVVYWTSGASPIEPPVLTAPSLGDASPATDGGPADAGAADGDGGPVKALPPPADSGPASAPDAAPAKAPDAGPAKAEAVDLQKHYTPSELFKKVSPAVVTISARGGESDEGEERSGTGFFIDEEGTIATNEHVIHGAKAVGVKLIGEAYPGGHRWLAKVELLEANPDIDLALLRVQPQDDIEPLQLGDSDSVSPGDDVICIGNPLGLEHTLSDGIVSARRVHEGKRWVQMTAPISPGNSGGPVLTMDGRVIGIATATVNRLLGTAQNLNLAVPVNELKAMIRDDYPNRHYFETGPDGPSSW
jgi:serine protease Do